MKIQDLRAREIIDCKGKPLLEVDIITEDGTMGRAASPSGISAGEHEAMVLRDGDQSRYDGNGVRKAVEAFRKAGMTDVKEKLYPLCRHEILNEINKQEVYDDVLSWITGKVL